MSFMCNQPGCSANAHASGHGISRVWTCNRCGRVYFGKPVSR